MHSTGLGMADKFELRQLSQHKPMHLGRLVHLQISMSAGEPEQIDIGQESLEPAYFALRTLVYRREKSTMATPPSTAIELKPSLNEKASSRATTPPIAVMIGTLS